LLEAEVVPAEVVPAEVVPAAAAAMEEATILTVICQG